MQNTLYQISKAEQALQRNPTNTVLIALKKDLEQLLELYQTQSANSQASIQSTDDGPKQDPPVTSKDRKEPVKNVHSLESNDSNNSFYKWSIGETAMCKWKDGHFYEAVVLEINGNDEYQVGFVGYDDIDVMHPSNMKHLMLDQKVKEASVSKDVGEIKDEKKVKKPKLTKTGEKKIRKRDVEQNSKQQAWQNFLKKK